MNETISQDMSYAPMGDILRTVATAIADAQFELDKSSLTVAELMSGRYRVRDEAGKAGAADTVIDTRIPFGYTREDGELRPARVSALDLGFTPAFYQFVDTVIELKIALRLGKDPGQRTVATGASVDGGYASTYGFDVKYASVFKTRLAPVPPPPSLDSWLEEQHNRPSDLPI